MYMELVTWICVCISEVMWSLNNIKEEKKDILLSYLWSFLNTFPIFHKHLRQNSHVEQETECYLESTLRLLQQGVVLAF